MTTKNQSRKLLDAALEHMALERAAACVLRVPDTDPPLFVAVGSAPAIVELLQGEADYPEPVAMVTAGRWGSTVAFLANGKDTPPVGTLLYTRQQAAASSAPGAPEADLSSLQKWWYTFDGMQPSETSETSDQVFYAVEDIQKFIASRLQAVGKAPRDKVIDEAVRALLDGRYWNGCPMHIYKTALDRAEAIRQLKTSRPIGWKMGDAGWEPIVHKAAQLDGGQGEGNG